MVFQRYQDNSLQEYLHHLPALMAITTPIPRSYLRIRPTDVELEPSEFGVLTIVRQLSES